ncbi:MAG TPA: hypothetical protein VNU64_03065 [Burkholderiales bacterium]|nr:hypothetical protein [Burkholderiales bacterium]
MERNFLPDAHPRASTGAFHDYVRGVFADRADDPGRLAEARAYWLRRLGERVAPLPAQERWEGEGGSTG